MAREITPITNGEVLAMSVREREYSAAMRQIEGGLGKRQAAAKLGISRRHASRLYNRWLLGGDAALVSRKRGRVGNRRRLETRSAFITWYEELSAAGRYAPKHASEMYEQESGIKISKESVRLWLDGGQGKAPEGAQTPLPSPPTRGTGAD